VDGAVCTITYVDGGMTPYPGRPNGHGVDAEDEDGDADASGAEAAWLSGQDAADGVGKVRATDKPVAAEEVVSHGRWEADADGAGGDGARSSTAVRREAKCPICCWRL
jgi:hypothetical protein